MWNVQKTPWRILLYFFWFTRSVIPVELTSGISSRKKLRDRGPARGRRVACQQFVCAGSGVMIVVCDSKSAFDAEAADGAVVAAAEGPTVAVRPRRPLRRVPQLFTTVCLRRRRRPSTVTAAASTCGRRRRLRSHR